MRPALLLPGVRNFHSEVHTWTVEASVEETIDALWKASDELDNYVPVERTANTVVIDYLTKAAKWLDQMTITVSSKDGVTVCEVTDGSTGFLPLVIPLAPILNIFFCWFPFGDNGKCVSTMNDLRKKASQILSKEISSKVVRASITNFDKEAGNSTKSQ
eukprot:CAMPEP_0171486596 /NCGR_PEP_ID=MMETSP0958-20121227/1177_1 /TAXON_ID=87120 /ORGANISM="Aurantiochytrium limacinum, Strain ATCCMYA-1381" /LENGTH=158 /DNA_ID=CAMNT_0012019491 /DNA_START=245 /DNA_END=721 /DNA_ORIENTATION=-